MLFRPKKCVLKMSKNRNFSKGLVNGYCENVEYFITGRFWAN